MEKENQKDKDVHVGIIIFLLLVIIGILALFVYWWYQKQKPLYKKWFPKKQSKIQKFEKSFSQFTHTIMDGVSDAYLDFRKNLGKTFSTKKNYRYPYKKNS